MVDFTTTSLLAASFFFVALAFALLVRYRQVSQRINASTDLGHDLWTSLEQRLKKQDERILDVMGRLEVIQARAMAAAAAQPPPTLSPLPPIVPPVAPTKEEHSDEAELSPITQQPESQESQPSQTSQAPAEPKLAGIKLDETQLKALTILKDASKSTPDIVKALGKSREHTGRLMKELFDLGLVGRNDASKPFVYQLTDEGRRHLPAS